MRDTLIALMAATFVVMVGFGRAEAQPGTVIGAHKINRSDLAYIDPPNDPVTDTFGYGIENLGDLDGDGVGDIAAGAFRDDDGSTGPCDVNNSCDRGAVWILFLNPDGTVKTTPPPHKISDTSGDLFPYQLDDTDEFGYGLAALGDLDGDGVTELAVGAGNDDDGASDRGAVYILFLNTDGTVKSVQKISDTSGNFSGFLNDNGHFGSDLADIGDLDGDTVPDLAVGSSSASYRGAVWILFLNSDGTVKTNPPPQKIANAELGGGLDPYDALGNWLAAADLDGDGVVDLAAGVYRDDDGSPGPCPDVRYSCNKGAVWILFLNSDGTLKSYQKISDTEGNFNGYLDELDAFGAGVAFIGDVDGDGIPDLAAAAPGDDDGGPQRGAVWILFLNSDGTVKSSPAPQKISSTSGNFGGPLVDDDHFGSMLAALPDINGDGLDDLAARSQDAVWILFLDHAVCGDGLAEGAECCDLGAENGVPGSGCTATCGCTGACTQSSTECATEADCPPGEGCCGNRTIEGDEECDDGNLQDGDCCSSTCLNESIPVCVPPCENVAGPHLLSPVSMRARFKDRDGDLKLERWTTSRKGQNGDFNLGFGQSVDCRSEDVRVVFTENDGSGGRVVLGQFTIQPDDWDKTSVKPNTDDETCKMKDPGETRSDADGVGFALIRERGTKVKYKFKGKMLAQIAKPSQELIRVCVHVGDDAGTGMLRCVPNRRGDSYKCDATN